MKTCSQNHNAKQASTRIVPTSNRDIVWSGSRASRERAPALGSCGRGREHFAVCIHHPLPPFDAALLLSLHSSERPMNSAGSVCSTAPSDVRVVKGGM